MEIWKNIKGFEGLYQVSNYGRVKSLQRKVRWRNGTRTINERVLHFGYDKNYQGYQIVVLSKNGICKTYKVHRLVAEAFIPNPDKLPQVNHKDESKENNHCTNLEWCSRSYNINYGNRNKSVSKSVLQFDMNGNFIKEWGSTMEVQREKGYSNQNISACCNGLYSQSYGYVWKYKQ